MDKASGMRIGNSTEKSWVNPRGIHSLCSELTAEIDSELLVIFMFKFKLKHIDLLSTLRENQKKNYNESLATQENNNLNTSAKPIHPDVSTNDFFQENPNKTSIHTEKSCVFELTIIASSGL